MPKTEQETADKGKLASARFEDLVKKRVAAGIDEALARTQLAAAHPEFALKAGKTTRTVNVEVTGGGEDE